MRRSALRGYSVCKCWLGTELEEARIGLSEYRVAAGIAVSDMNGAREFYEGKLGLLVGIDSGDNLQYRCGEGSVMHVYLSPEHASKSTAILAGESTTPSRL